MTAPFAFLDQKKRELDSYAKGTNGPGWTTPPVSLEELRDGVKHSLDRHLNGISSLEWRNLPKYPSVASRKVPDDWSAFGGIQLSLYSEKATGDVITLGVQSGWVPATFGPGNRPGTAPSFMCRDFVVDWSGWRDVVLPFSGFWKINAPSGWNSVGGLYLFSKCRYRSPDPATALFIDRIALLPKAPQQTASTTTPSNVQAPAYSPATNGDLFFVEQSCQYGAPVRLNHDGPEVSHNLDPGTPLVHLAYFSGARALFAYHPRYNPGAVSFDPQGHAFLRNDYTIDWLDEKGRWQETDLSSTLREYARQQKWKGIGFSSGRDEPKVRFDKDGTVYVLVSITQQVAEDKEDARFRATLLLHAKALGQPWLVDKLPWQTDFENIDTFNVDALNHPPVIIFKKGPAGYLILPEKKPDGSLLMPAPIKFSDYAFAGPVHSGGGNFVISKGDFLYVVYSFTPPLPGPIPWTLVGDDKWKAALPPIPADHPARSMTFENWSRGQGSPLITRSASGGMPTYVVAYNRTSKQLSPPVFVGYGGSRMDPHNWPAMTIDGAGNLHVVIAGHCEPLTYTHTITPGDITRWSVPVYIKKAPGKNDNSLCSYPTLNFDRNGNLLCVVRSDTEISNHRLAVLTKPAGTESWNEERPLMVPATNGYHVWQHRVSYNPATDRFYVGYFDCEMSGTKEQDLFSSFTWPDLKHLVITDFTILVSDDFGKTWRLATTPDFK